MIPTGERSGCRGKVEAVGAGEHQVEQHDVGVLGRDQRGDAGAGARHERC